MVSCSGVTRRWGHRGGFDNILTLRLNCKVAHTHVLYVNAFTALHGKKCIDGKTTDSHSLIVQFISDKKVLWKELKYSASVKLQNRI